MNFQERYQYDAQKDLLGKGGFSTVYLAKDKLLDRFVALKFFKNQDLHKYDVLTEIRKVIQLEHPNITRYYDVVTLENRTVHGEIEKLQVGIMEYINGGDIATFLKKYPNQFDNLIRQVLQGMQYLHDNNIIHRDLKPQNILIKNQDGVCTAKITDFGISKVVDSNSTSSHGLLGTLAYMSPEQLDPKNYGIDGKISTNLDFWSFGILLYGLLTNTHPFIDNNSNTAEQILRNILMADISSKINTVESPIYRAMLEKCLVKDANKRVKSAYDLLNIKLPEKENKQLEKPQKLRIESKQKQDNPIIVEKVLYRKSVDNGNISVYKNLFFLICTIILVYLISNQLFNKDVPNETNLKSQIKDTNETNKKAILETTNINVSDIFESMILVEGGIFKMGSKFEDESPIHNVSISTFYLSKYEVTNKQWEKIMGSINLPDNWSTYKDCDNCPVALVNWNEVQLFINKLNDITKNKYRLPTEAEWEYAARGGSLSKGNKYAGSNSIEDVGWTANGKDEINTPSPVGTKRPNELGIYDMSGNVWEWCQDWYDEQYYSKSELQNPQGPKLGTSKVIRGGDVSSGHPYSNNGSAKVTNRLDTKPDDRHISGFRLAMSKN